jgi:hypothetical protein
VKLVYAKIGIRQLNVKLTKISYIFIGSVLTGFTELQILYMHM